MRPTYYQMTDLEVEIRNQKSQIYKDLERAKIAKQIEEFERKGGKIKQEGIIVRGTGADFRAFSLEKG